MSSRSRNGAIPADPRRTVSQKRDSAGASALPHAMSFQGELSCLRSRATGFWARPALPCLGVCSRWRSRRPAQQVAANDAAGDLETVVVTGTAFNADIAPAKASLETMEPQTIINQSYIQDSVADTADYTTILAIAPSMTGHGHQRSGPFGRRRQEHPARPARRQFRHATMTAFPSATPTAPRHHSESYFPGATIGSIDVDRGPGNAGNMGASTFGGTINMFSEVLTAGQPRHGPPSPAAAWAPTMSTSITRPATSIVAGMTTRTLVNFQDTSSDGYLTCRTPRARISCSKRQTRSRPAGP